MTPHAMKHSVYKHSKITLRRFSGLNPISGAAGRNTMRTMLRKTSAGFRRGTALLLMLAMLAAALPAAADTARENRIDEMTGETQETLAEVMLAKRAANDESLKNIQVRQNGLIIGRGISDEPSGAEPYYIGLVGYAAVANDESAGPGPDGISFQWSVPSYMVFEKRWYYTKSLQHKTGVLVLNQLLKETGKGRYTGRLRVIRLDSGEICWMDVENFVTVPYWFYPARRAMKYGNTVSAYRQKGKRMPTDSEGNPVEIGKDTPVLIPGNGVWDMKAPEGSQMIPGVVYEEQTGVSDDGTEHTEIISRVLLFPEEDLATIY